MTVRTLHDLGVDGRRVFLRLDLNVPLDPEGEITDDTRIQAALPTIQELIARESRLVIASHLGRPKGTRDPAFSMEPVAARLAHLLDGEIILSEDSIGDGPRKMAFALREGQIMLLENLRFYPGETGNDDSFAKQLASLADIYLNDAFGTMHREHASIVGVPKYLKEKGIGRLAEIEVSCLTGLAHKPERPLVAIIGGAKVKDKVGLLLSLVEHVDVLCLGGAMALTFLAAGGSKLGNSRVEQESFALAEKVRRKAKKNGVKLVLPVDHVAVEELAEGAPFETVGNNGFPENLVAVDVGPATVAAVQEQLESARTVFWNGPFGVFEVPPFHRGTEAIGKAVARSNAFSVVGGGDSVAAIRKGGLAPFVRHISTGGGASLKFLEGKPLPGLAILDEE